MALIAQLGEHCTGIAEVVGSNPAQSLKIFSGLCSGSVTAALALMTVITQLLLWDKLLSSVTIVMIVIIVIIIIVIMIIMITIIIISNSNWTEWSTIQGVIARVISKLDEREADLKLRDQNDYSLNCMTRGHY